jgi:chromate reductase
MGPRKVGLIVGSLRKESFNRKVANALKAIPSDKLTLEDVEIAGLPFYNQDWDADPLMVVREFKATLRAMDGILFVTPEYNRSVPGVLKNAIDVGSRPYGDSAWNGKPAAIISVTPGALGAFGANHHLRQSLVFLNMPTLAQPEAYVANVATVFDGAVLKPDTQEFLVKFLDAFAAWIGHNTAR